MQDPNADRLVVYHGTTEEFDKFDLGRSRTARDIYATTIVEHAECYGPVVLEFEIIGRIGDFRPEYRGVEEEKALAIAYFEELVDYWDTLEEFIEDFDSGSMYQKFAKSYPQDAFVSALVDQGFDALMIPDAGFQGHMSESVVTRDPEVFRRTQTPAFIRSARPGF